MDGDSLHQQIMSQAYDRWDGTKQTYNEFVDSCDTHEKVAVLTGNFNYQVENGGIGQWVSNGYCLQARELMEHLLRISPHVPLAHTIIEIVREVEPYINFDAEDRGCWENYLLEIDEDEDGFSETEKHFDALTDRYYRINEAFMLQMEEYFIKLQAGEIIPV